MIDKANFASALATTAILGTLTVLGARATSRAFTNVLGQLLTAMTKE